jgi:hypothetical protein
VGGLQTLSESGQPCFSLALAFIVYAARGLPSISHPWLRTKKVLPANDSAFFGAKGVGPLASEANGGPLMPNHP